jgi:Mrp family chromosome partitioning ATPase
VFTSASPGEGKTTVVSNLAISLAQINQRVLLIDADMRLPRAHMIFDTPNNFGLSDVLNERKPIDEYLDESLVRKTSIPNLFLLPAGRPGPTYRGYFTPHE